MTDSPNTVSIPSARPHAASRKPRRRPPRLPSAPWSSAVSRSPSSPSSAKPRIHAFLYGNADLRARIERLRAQARPKPPPPEGTGSDNTMIQALTSQIHLKKQHRDESAALRAALEQAHGENLELRRELARLGGNLQPSTTS